jgi:hypothetical protein
MLTLLMTMAVTMTVVIPFRLRCNLRSFYLLAVAVTSPSAVRARDLVIAGSRT